MWSLLGLKDLWLFHCRVNWEVLDPRVTKESRDDRWDIIVDAYRILMMFSKRMYHRRKTSKFFVHTFSSGEWHHTKINNLLVIMLEWTFLKIKSVDFDFDVPFVNVDYRSFEWTPKFAQCWLGEGTDMSQMMMMTMTMTMMMMIVLIKCWSI